MEEDQHLAFLFPGQGSQAVGMCQELYQQSKAARQVFEEADATLGFSLSRLCFEGPADQLKLTINTQPAIFTASVACLRALAERKEESISELPLFMAGHSLGEYTALVASGSMKFDDALRLVRRRGELMQYASDRLPGGMAAIIGLDEATLEELCQQTGAQIANVNTAEQIVISGSREALARTIDLARLRGAKRALPLEVGGAFHSALMQPALTGLQEAVAQVRIDDPRVPVIANTTALPLTTAESVRTELPRQVCQKVHWQRSIEYMLNAGVTTFVEIGPGQVLSGLVKRINGGAQAYSIGNLAAIETLNL